MEKGKKVTYKDIFHQKEYMKLILASLINRFGDSIDAIAFTWIVYEISGNAALSAVVYGINKLPTVFLTPLTGAWVEGKRKKTIMITTDMIRAICVAFIATGYFVGVLQPWMLIVATLIISTAEAFRIPAGSTLTPKVLERQYFEYGMSLMSTLSGITELVGTISAAGIIAFIGVAGAIYLDMITFVLSALIILTIRIREKNLEHNKFDSKKYFGDLKAGFVYVKNKKVISFMLGLAVFINGILVPVNSLEAPMANEILHYGAEALSFFGAASTIGMLVGSICYPMIKGKCKGKTLLIGCCLAIALFYIGIPAATPIYSNAILGYCWLCFVSAVTGMFMALASSYINVLCVSIVEENYMARFFGITTSLNVASVPVISFLTGILVKGIGIKVLFYISGILSILVSIYIFKNCCIQEDENEEKQEEIESVSA